MDVAVDFMSSGGIGVFRPRTLDSIQHAIRTVTAAIAHARAAGIAKLLVDATALSGVRPPGIGTRHQMAREWAEAAGGELALAVVVRREYIDPEKFGVVVAGNFGLVSNVFDRVEDALEWLRALKGTQAIKST